MVRVCGLARVFACAVLALVASGAAAQLPTIGDPYSLRQQNSANSNNFATGDFMRWGVIGVVPANTNPLLDPDTWGVTRQCPAGLDCAANPNLFVRQALFAREFTVYGGDVEYFASRPYDTSLLGSWFLTLSAEPTFPVANRLDVPTPAIGGIGLMPYVPSMTVQGAGTTPTVSWTLPTLPAGLELNGITVLVTDLTSLKDVVSTSPSGGTDFKQADVVFFARLAGNETSFQIPDGTLQLGRQYSIGIRLEDWRDAAGTGVTANLESVSTSFFEFTPVDTGGLNVFLPTTVPVPTTSGLLAGLLYSFEIQGVSPNEFTFIDPFVATGFEYIKGDTDPNFKGVKVVTNAGDGVYEVWIWDETTSSWILVDNDLMVDEAFDFVDDGGIALGVDRFQIRGIETSANVSPFDLTAFITGLTFMEAGNFTGTMQAIVAEVGVPEPGTLALICVALGVFYRIRVYRRR